MQMSPSALAPFGITRPSRIVDLECLKFNQAHCTLHTLRSSSSASAFNTYRRSSCSYQCLPTKAPSMSTNHGASECGGIGVDGFNRSRWMLVGRTRRSTAHKKRANRESKGSHHPTFPRTRKRSHHSSPTAASSMFTNFSASRCGCFGYPCNNGKALARDAFRRLTREGVEENPGPRCCSCAGWLAEGEHCPMCSPPSRVHRRIRAPSGFPMGSALQDDERGGMICTSCGQNRAECVCHGGAHRSSLANDGSTFGAPAPSSMQPAPSAPQESCFVCGFAPCTCTPARQSSRQQPSRASSAASVPDARPSNRQQPSATSSDTPPPKVTCTCGRAPGRQGRHKRFCALTKEGAKYPTNVVAAPHIAPPQPSSTTHAPALSFSPSDVVKLDVGVVEIVENSCRLQAAKALERALSWGLEYFFCFGKLCLARRPAAQIRSACLRFAQGKVNELYEEVRNLAAEKDPQRTRDAGVPMDEGEFASDIEPDKIPEATLARAEFLARQGFFGRASASLNCAALAPATEDTYTKLRNLHPHGSGIASTALPANASAWTPFTSQEIRSALSGISRGSSGGPSRVARDHILPLARTPGMGDLIIDLLTRRANELITSPDAPITHFFFSAR